MKGEKASILQAQRLGSDKKNLPRGWREFSEKYAIYIARIDELKVAGLRLRDEHLGSIISNIWNT